MTTSGPMGVPVGELTDEELERQGTHAHATRNWVFLHGTAEQFATHTARMLEQEYVRRHPKRTWQGVARAGTEVVGDPVLELLRRIAAEPGGRMHKLEVHQLARELGVDRTSLARLYTGKPSLLATEQQDRVITDAGRERVAQG